jgi:hypothetical protein
VSDLSLAPDAARCVAGDGADVADPATVPLVTAEMADRWADAAIAVIERVRSLGVAVDEERARTIASDVIDRHLVAVVRAHVEVAVDRWLVARRHGSDS